MNKIFNSFISNSPELKRGIKNSFYLSVAKIISRLISIVGFIYIPNKLGAYEYGLFTTSIAFIGLFGFLSFKGLTKVILREASRDIDYIKKIINNLFQIRVLLSIFQIISILIALFFISNYSLDLKLLIIIATTEALFVSLSSLPRAIIQSDERVKTLAIIKILFIKKL